MKLSIFCQKSAQMAQTKHLVKLTLDFLKSFFHDFMLSLCLEMLRIWQ